MFPELRDLIGTAWTHWQRRVEWAIIELLAGPLAELRYLNAGWSPAGVLYGTTGDADGDFEKMGILIECLYGKGENKIAMWMHCDETRKILREPRTWGALEQLAGRLIEVGFVSSEDAEGLFEKWQVPTIPKAV